MQVNRNALLGKIHVAIKQLGMSDPDYRALLNAKFGKDSAAKLSGPQLLHLVEHFRSRGWQEKPRRGKPKPPSSKQDQVDKIGALLAEIHRVSGKSMPWSYAVAILRRQGGPEKLEWATPKQLRAVIAALAKRLQTLEQQQLLEQAL